MIVFILWQTSLKLLFALVLIIIRVHTNKTLLGQLIDQLLLNGQYQNERTKEVPSTLVRDPVVNITLL